MVKKDKKGEDIVVYIIIQHYKVEISTQPTKVSGNKVL